MRSTADLENTEDIAPADTFILFVFFFFLNILGVLLRKCIFFLFILLNAST